MHKIIPVLLAMCTLVGAWVPQPGPTGANLNGIDGREGYIVGDSGVFLRDLRGSWPVGQDASPDYQREVTGTSQNLHAIHCINTCFVVGDEGTILHRTTQGWQNIPSGTSLRLRSVYFHQDADSGYVAGDSGTILKRQGAQWTRLPTGTTQDLYHVHFQYNYWSGNQPHRYDTGFAVGGGGVILKSTDRGASWTSLPSGTTRTLRAFHIRDNAAVAFAVGDSGTILRTSNRGSSWTQVASGTVKTLRAVVFASPENGIIVGDSGTVLTSVDSGLTWQVASTASGKSLRGVQWGGGHGVTVVGEGGTILTENASISVRGTPGVRKGRGLGVDAVPQGVRFRDEKGQAYDARGVLHPPQREP